MAAQQEDKSKTILAVGALLLVYMAGDKIFKFLGLSKTAEEEKKEEEKKKNYEAMLSQQYFDSDYYRSRIKAGYTVAIMSQVTADGLNKILWEAKGIPYLTNDDEPAVYGVFKSLSYKTQVSYLTERFFAVYHQDLKAFLQSFLNNDEFGNVIAICERMKEGISKDKGKTYE